MEITTEDTSTILIIDDNVDTIRLLSSMISDQGRVIFATEGRNGIVLAKRELPQLILLDVEMSTMDGYEVCRLIRNDPAMDGTAIVFVTARSSTQDEIACLEAGAVDYITKPLNAPLVQARVRTHLRLQHALRTLSSHAKRDGLTGVYNRRYFDELSAVEFGRHKRHSSPLAIALIDVDNFKAYNDTHGHQNGDRCLVEVATAVSSSIKRPGEFVARYGGEEFVVVLPGVQTQALDDIGTLICSAVRKLEIPHGGMPARTNLTVSVGLSVVSGAEDDSLKALIGRADDALYAAKAAGRDRYVVR